MPVSVGSIKVNSLHDLEIHDLAIYDKQAECIAQADTARVELRLLSAYRDPAHVVQSVTLSHVKASLVQREDGTWNVEDIETKGSGEGSFFGTVKVEDGEATVTAQGREVTASAIEGSLDFSDYPVLKLSAKANCLGSSVEVSGTYRKERQIFNAELSGLDVMNVLPLLPDGTLPDGIEVLGGTVTKAKVAGQYMGSQLSFSGQAEYEGGSVKVKETQVDDIHGFISFTDAEALLSADAEAAGQQAHVNGKVRYDTGAPYLDLHVASDSFDPSKVLKDIPYEGAAAVKAHVTGTPTARFVSLPARRRASRSRMRARTSATRTAASRFRMLRSMPLAARRAARASSRRQTSRTRHTSRPVTSMCSRQLPTSRSSRTSRAASPATWASPARARTRAICRRTAVRS